MALSAKNRLSKKRDFDTAFKNGKTVRGSFLFIKLAQNGQPVSRFGFVISSKVLKRATTRNKIRRYLSDFIRFNINKIKAGYDIIVIIRNGAVEIDKLREDLRNILGLSRII
ncbi:MAG: ribonuclease P protein component [Candidatus Yanofskybacteria bacterium]|nr:ribonuclease P protein component [Candidatus Yanofskybacteria bacterium]